MPFLVAPRICERRFQTQIIAYAVLMGWRHYHTHDARRSAPGFPDLVLVRRPRLVFAEVKADRTPVTDDQTAWLEELRASGQEVYLWRPSHWRQIETVLR